jgi:sec-independent protein translocase protein TatA
MPPVVACGSIDVVACGKLKKEIVMGIGPWHLLALIAIVLIFFGPSRLPTLGKSMGEAIRGFKKGINGEEIDVTDSTKRESLNASGEDTMTKKSTSEKDKA